MFYLLFCKRWLSRNLQQIRMRPRACDASLSACLSL
jgi:hypothetical protein